MDLVEKALATNHAITSSKEYTREEVRLAHAWVNGKVTMKQASVAMGKSRNMYSSMASILKYGRIRGWITVNENEV